MMLPRPERSLTRTRWRLPTASGRDVLVGGGILQHGADVHAALVREGALAHEGLVVAQRQIGQLGDEQLRCLCRLLGSVTSCPQDRSLVRIVRIVRK